MIGPILGLIGTGVKGLFGMKEDQAQTVHKALDMVSNVNATDEARSVAAAQIISAEANSESVITRMWRPVVVLSFTVLLFSFFLGYTPDNVSPHMIDRIFDLVEYSVLGYMGARSIDKWVKELSLGSVVKKFVEKKVL